MKRETKKKNQKMKKMKKIRKKKKKMKKKKKKKKKRRKNILIKEEVIKSVKVQEKENMIKIVCMNV